MRDTGERTAVILRRTRVLRRRRERRGSAGLAAICCALLACLAGLIRALPDGAGHVPGLYGASLMYGGAGGYVLAGVLAFAAGAAVTLLCIRYRKKNGDNDKEEKK